MARLGEHIVLLCVLFSAAIDANDNIQDGATLEDLQNMMGKVLEQNRALVDVNNELRSRNAELERRLWNLEKEMRYKDNRKTVGAETSKRDVNVMLDHVKNVQGKRFLADFASVGTTAFSAVVSTPDLTVAAGQDIVFDQTITNIANAYDNTTGIFTAPIRGVYVFNFAVMINAGDNEYVEIVVDGKHLMWNYGHAQGSLHYISASRTVTVALDSGAQVWVRVYQSSHHGTGRVHGNGYTTFSGWLIAITE